MYRTERDTSKWFLKDHVTPIQDREKLDRRGPGSYETNNRLQADDRKQSWNSGKIPFKSGNERFKDNEF